MCYLALIAFRAIALNMGQVKTTTWITRIENRVCI